MESGGTFKRRNYVIALTGVLLTFGNIRTALIHIAPRQCSIGPGSECAGRRYGRRDGESPHHALLRLPI